MLCCDAFRALQQASTTSRNRVCHCFLQEEVSTRKLPTLYPQQKWPLHSERSPRDLSQRQIFQESSSFTSCRPLPRMGHLASPVMATLCLEFLEGLGVVEPHLCLTWTFLWHLYPLLLSGFLPAFPPRLEVFSLDVRGSLTKSSLTFVIYGWQRGLLGISN